MPYLRSRARKRFDFETGNFLKTLGEAYSSSCSSASVRAFALCSAVMLCSARIESYLEDLLGDWSQSVKAPHLTTNNLPKRTRAFLLNHTGVSAAYRRYVCYGSESELLTKLEAQVIGQTAYEFAIDGRAIPAFPINAIYKDRKYPSVRNLQELFNRFGFPNIFDELNRIGRRDTKALLVSFNDLRTEMAHSGMPVGLTPGDIRLHVKNMRSLVGYIDRVFYSHVAKTLGAARWVV
jgi:hypothetical protein